MVKKIITAKHRGFCAGVERAVEMVEKSLTKYGAPVYVRHEIVHNKFVVNNLREKGVVFVDSLEEIPKNTKQPVIFSAHGVAQRVINKAKDYNLLFYDAICPLVSKIHKEIIQLENNEYKIIMIGHEHHPEVDGTAGQLKDISNLTLVQDIDDVDKLYFPSSQKLAYITQTTLSVFDTQDIVDALEKNTPQSLHRKNQIFATQLLIGNYLYKKCLKMLMLFLSSGRTIVLIQLGWLRLPKDLAANIVN